MKIWSVSLFFSSKQKPLSPSLSLWLSFCSPPPPPSHQVLKTVVSPEVVPGLASRRRLINFCLSGE